MPCGEELQDLLARAQSGDKSVLPELRRVLDENPTIWQFVGDLAARAQASMIGLVAGDDLVAEECLHRKLAELKTEFAEQTDSPAERLLIERITISWLQCAHADCMLAQVRGIDLRQAGFMQTRIDRAQRRFLQAIRQLAVVRKLLAKARRKEAKAPEQRYGSEPASIPQLRVRRPPMPKAATRRNTRVA